MADIHGSSPFYMLGEQLWAFEQVMEELVRYSALERLVSNNRVRKKLLVEHAPVRAPLRTIPEHYQTPLRERRS